MAQCWSTSGALGLISEQKIKVRELVVVMTAVVVLLAALPLSFARPGRALSHEFPLRLHRTSLDTSRLRAEKEGRGHCSPCCWRRPSATSYWPAVSLPLPNHPLLLPMKH